MLTLVRYNGCILIPLSFQKYLNRGCPTSFCLFFSTILAVNMVVKRRQHQVDQLQFENISKVEAKY